MKGDDDEEFSGSQQKNVLKLRKHISTHNCPQFMKTKIKTKQIAVLFFFSISEW